MNVKLFNMSENTTRNFHMVTINDLDLYFSYETVVAFQRRNKPLIVSENIWTKTTGKHLNWISNKEDRMEHKDFLRLLNIELAEGIGEI